MTRPTKEYLLDLFERITPRDFHEPVKNHESYALIRALAQINAQISRSGEQYLQGAFYLPHASQKSAPASSATKSSLDVTLRRSGPSEFGIQAPIGAIKIQASGGRVYANAEEILLHPDIGPSADETFLFTCEYVGSVGNLDHVADDSGNIQVDSLTLVDQSRGRANYGGRIVTTGVGVVVYDDGNSPTLLPEDVGLYLKLHSTPSSADAGRIVSATGFSAASSEYPTGSGLYPRGLFVDTNEIVIPREVYVHDVSVGYTDITGVTLATTGQALAFPATPATNDALYISNYGDTSGVVIDVTVGGTGSYTLAWEYWNGSTWVTIVPSLDTSGDLRTTGRHFIKWPAGLPHVPRASNVSSQTWTIVRARLATGVMSTVPQISRVSVRTHRPLTPGIPVVWAVEDYKDLGLVVTGCKINTAGRDNHLWFLGDERGMYQQSGESDDAFRKRITQLGEVVSPNAIRRMINRSLAPFGAEGRAIDPGNGLTGIFGDVDFLDYYTPGDLHPDPVEDPYRTLLSLEETYGFFLVELPFLSTGEFGAFLDQGPTLDTGVEFLANGADIAFMDGYPVEAYGTYQAIWETIDKIKAFGIRFLIVRVPIDNLLSC